jgi:hypothetical protein
MRFLILLALLSTLGCSGGTAPSACPGCGVRSLAITYNGSFVQGSPSPPVQFTATGETATLTVKTYLAGKEDPPSTVTGAPSGTCNAVSIQSTEQAGTIDLESIASGSCVILLNTRAGQTSIQVSVP